MSFNIKNSSLQILAITLNSGKTVHLAPQEVSEPMEEIEIKGNAKLEKMKKSSLITIEEKKKKKGEEEKKPKGKNSK